MLQWHNISDGRFKYVRHQNSSHTHLRLIDIPIHPALSDALSVIPNDAHTFLQMEAGKERAAAGLGNTMRKWCNAAGLKQCTPFGLRKACGRRLAEAGMKEQEISAVLGYSDTNAAHGIVGMGDRRELANAAISAMRDAGADVCPRWQATIVCSAMLLHDRHVHPGGGAKTTA